MILKKLKKTTTYEIKETKNNEPTNISWGIHDTMTGALFSINEFVNKWFQGCGRPKNRTDYCVIQVDMIETWIVDGIPKHEQKTMSKEEHRKLHKEQQV